MHALSQSDAIRGLNRKLVNAVENIPGVGVLDFDRLCAEQGYRHWQHAELWYQGHAPLSPGMAIAVAKTQAAAA